MKKGLRRRAWTQGAARFLALGCVTLFATACSAADTSTSHAVTARILGTIQGRVTTTSVSSLISIDFLTPSYGYAAAENCILGTNRCVAELGTTRDGGRTFSWLPLGPGAAQSVQFVDRQHGWVLMGTYNQPQRLLGTTDGGRTWHVIEQAQTFMGVPNFISDTVGYALEPGTGAPGVMNPTVLLSSQDGGRTWHRVATDGYYPANVDFLTAERGYITGWRCSPAGVPVGSCQGAILSTSDGGQHWYLMQRIGTTETGNVGTFAVDFLSPDTGFAALPNLQGNSMGGGLSALERTTDGGRTWQLLQTAYQWGASIRVGWPSTPQFVNPELGWIALTPGAGPGAGGVLVTTDGGQTFDQYGAADYITGSLDPVGGVAYAIVSPVPNGGWGSALVVIRPDGTVRQLYPSPIPSGGLPPQGIGTLFAFGMPSDPTALLASRDGGEHWITAGDAPGRPSLVSFSDSHHGYALVQEYTQGDQGYRTSDGGRIWRAVGRALQDQPTYVRLFPNGVLVAASPDGAVLRSTNTGSTWTTVGHMPRGIVWSLSFATTETAFAYLGDAQSPKLYETQNGGRTWRPLLRLPMSSRGESPGRLMALDADGFGLLQRYAGGGPYLVTHDGGRTWHVLDLPKLVNAAALTVSGKNLALIATASSLYRTTDGGVIWQSILSPLGH